jgi:4-diphosphocytidyl-2-C-methyl-D-erythritol kinase
VGRSAHVAVEKHIPTGAGLGGGSADAAAVLRWAGCRDRDVAASLGADVPFCLVGGRARVTGIGEIVEPLPFEARTYTLLTPPFGCSTPAVYRAWDELGGPAGEAGNDLEPAALAVEPRLAEWRDRLGEATGQRPRLAGSGSTWFVEGDHPGDGRVVARTTGD